MGLNFAANGDLVDYAANAVLDLNTTGTVLMWIRLNDNTQRMTLWSRDGSTAGGTAYYSMDHRADLAGDYFEATRQRATTIVQCTSNAANFASYGLNKWLFLAFVFNTGGANGDQKLLMGDLSTPLTEASSYTTQTVGSGAVSTSYGTAAFRAGNSLTNTARETRGDIAWIGIWNTAMTLQEMVTQQFHPHVTSGNVLFTHLGYPATTCRDYSGNVQSGSVTGATNTAHVPQRPLYGGRSVPGYIVTAAPASGRSWGYVI